MKKNTISRLILLISLFLSIFGCGRLNLIKTNFEHQFKTNYKIAQSVRASVGDTMIKIENVFRKAVFTPKYEYTTPGQGIILKPGEKWISMYEIVGQDGYVIYKHDSKLGYQFIHIKSDGTIGMGWFDIDFAQSNPPYQSEWTKEQLFERAESENEIGSFVCELIYSGLSGRTIRISYREFSNDMARPAFYQDLTYELTESDTITFKSLRIKIFEATNSSIVFSVEEDKDLPWVPRK